MQEKSSVVLSVPHVLPLLHVRNCFLLELEVHSADCQLLHLVSWQTPLSEQSAVHVPHPEEGLHDGVHVAVKPSEHVDVFCGQTTVEPPEQEMELPLTAYVSPDVQALLSLHEVPGEGVQLPPLHDWPEYGHDVPVADCDGDGLFDSSHGLLVGEQVLVWV